MSYEYLKQQAKGVIIGILKNWIAQNEIVPYDCKNCVNMKDTKQIELSSLYSISGNNFSSFADNIVGPVLKVFGVRTKVGKITDQVVEYMYESKAHDIIIDDHYGKIIGSTALNIRISKDHYSCVGSNCNNCFVSFDVGQRGIMEFSLDFMLDPLTFFEEELDYADMFVVNVINNKVYYDIYLFWVLGYVFGTDMVLDIVSSMRRIVFELAYGYER